MIVRMNKAILHVFDFDSAVSVFSRSTLDLDDKKVKAYVSSVAKKGLGSTDARYGRFSEANALATKLSRYFHDAEEFIPLTREIAEYLSGELSRAEKVKSCDLLCVDLLDGDDTRWFGIFILDGRQAFMHEVSQAGENVSCDIVRRYAVLPNATQKCSSWALVRADNLEIRYQDKERVINGQPTELIPQGLFQCDTADSAKETLAKVTDIVEEVADEYGLNTAMALSRAKASLSAQVEETEALDCEKIAREVFEDSEQAQKKFEDKAEIKKLPKKVPVERKAVAAKSIRNHRIVTDTGIEVSFPAEYSESAEFIEFVSEPNGLISIELKNIGSIENK